MRIPHLDKLYGIFTFAALASALMSCNGGGSSGGTTTPPYTGPTTNVAQLSASEWANLSLTGSVVSATVSSGIPVVKIAVTDGRGVPVVGLGQKDADGKYFNFGFGIAKLVSGNPSHWVNYNVVSTPATGVAAVPGWPEVENTGTLKDNLDGTYTYTFALDLSKAKGYVDGATYVSPNVKADLGDLTFESGLPHRVFVTIGGNYSTSDTTQVLTSANAVKDFYPSTGGAVAEVNDRIIADLPSCNSCHTKLSMHADYYPPIQDTKLCVACHTDQMKYGSADSLPGSGTTLLANGKYGSTQKLMGRALADFPNMIHHIHQGEELYYQGYNQLGVQYNEVRFPQEKNCSKCHSDSATAQGGNWNTVPSRLACGACHDSVDFAAGTNHEGGAQTSDSACIGCHSTGGNAGSPAANHQWNDVTPLNPTPPTGLGNFTYDIKSVTLDGSRQPVVTFRISLNGTPITSFPATATVNNVVSGQVVVNPDSRTIPGYIGGPTIYVTYAQPQDGITSPADFNGRISASLVSLLVASGSPKTGSLSGPDSDGYLTATLTGDTLGQPTPYGTWTSPANPVAAYSPVKKTPFALPSDAAMITATILGSFTQVDFTGVDSDLAAKYAYTKSDPTQYDNAGTYGGTAAKPVIIPQTGGLNRPALEKQIALSTARRTIVDNNRCNNCHERLGTKPNFHGGASSLTTGGGAVGSGPRNDGSMCNICHTVNGTNSGWSYNAAYFVHAIHGGSKRTVPFTWHGTSTYNFSMLPYPAILKNCEQCHFPGTYDLSTNASAVPNMLWSTMAAGTLQYTSTGTVSPYISSTSTSYGTAYSSTSTTGTAPNQTTALTPTAATSATLVSSPITAACASCHDAPSAVAHMETNGGAFYRARSVVMTSGAFNKAEACLTCHGSGKVQDIKTVHMNYQ